MIPRLLVLAAALGAALPASAHPGHGDPALGDGWLHQLAEPRHAFAWMAAIALALAVGAIAARRRAAAGARARIR